MWYTARMNMKIAFYALAACSLALPCAAASSGQGGDAGKYVPEEWNVKARERFVNDRFGVFIHWGLYANYAQGEWYLLHGRLDEKAYSRMMYGFCPSKFDAREWVRTVKAAGAKYITITSRHHDGFSLWPTKADDGYNIANTPFRRDILGELAQACREEGVTLNFYYSLMDWHRKDYPAGFQSRKVLGSQKGDYRSYKKFMLAQIAELIENYHPANIWFDGEWDHTRNENGKWLRTLDWEMDSIYDFIHARRTLVGNNNHQTIRPKEDFQIYERDLPGGGEKVVFSKHQPVVNDRPIEQCDVIQHGAWGYRIVEGFRTPQDIVALVARAASRDSNLMMNVGPDGSGQFPAGAVKAMLEAGKWFARNGESIYGTRGCKVARGLDVVSTRRGGTIYLHFLNPKVDEISFNIEGRIVEAVYLDGGKPADASVQDGVAKVRISRRQGDRFDVVVKVTVE